MKTTKIFSLLFVIILITSCKQNDWLDWKTQNELWLEQNAKKAGVITTPTGLQYECLEPGIDGFVRPDDAKMVTIDYAGQLINGYQFDANNNYTGYVSSFVPGFSEGLKKMKQFGTYKLYIPYQLGYGENGTGTEGTSSHIPPYSTLIFIVHLSSVN